MMKRIFLYLLLPLLIVACADDDSFSASKSNRLTFGVDTLRMDTVFANVGSSTYSFWVYNRSADGIRLQSVRLRNGNQTGFRVNVDGTYLDNSQGAVASNLELRQGDSLRVFVEATLPETGQLDPQRVEEQLVFGLESGVEQQVCLRAFAWDAVRVDGLSVERDTTIESARPVVVYGDGVRVAEGAVLTIRNTTLYFHDQAGLRVDGSLRTENVVLRGDRLDYMFPYLPYDRISGQWDGVSFSATSTQNELTDTEIRNANHGIVLSDTAALDTLQRRLTMTRCTVHNTKGPAVVAYHSNLALSHCQLTNALGDCLAVYGGVCDIDHCTLAQFYPFSADRGAALRFADFFGDRYYPYLRLTCRNTIMTGYEADEVMLLKKDTTVADSRFSYLFENCLMRTPAVDDDTVSFRQIIWETPKDSVQGKRHFVTIDEQNLYYDFHLDSVSTAKGMGFEEGERR